MAGQGRAVLGVALGAIDAAELRVLAVDGEEAVSEPFRFDVELERIDGAPLELGALLGQDAALSFRWEDGTGRDVHGVVAAAQLVDVRLARGSPEPHPRYRLRVVPRLALLAQRGGSRVFQGESGPDVALKVLKDAGVKARLDLRGAYPPREYCLQWRESDLAFVARLLAEEGVSYRFEHAAGAHELVAFDAPDAMPDAPGDALPFRPAQAAAEGGDEHLTRLRVAHRVRTDAVALRDYDELRPDLRLAAEARAGDAPALEDYAFELAYADQGELKRLARDRLEAARVAVRTVEGEAVSLRVVPGTRLELAEHPDAAFNGKVQVLRAVHAGRQAATGAAAGGTGFSWVTRFVAQAAGAGLRPRRILRPPAHGVQSAVVVGPSGEEIHADAHGRIKIQFQWDRLGGRDDHASAFVRVAQPWAGPGQGTLRLPRAGQEVLVRFLGGDPDAPLVVGAVYHGGHPPPLSLPGDKTRSTLRSDSSPGGGGSNELRFEDAKGSEEVFEHAQKDLVVAAENDEAHRVKRSAGLLVKKDRILEVGGDQDLAVGAFDRARVLGSQTLTVAGARQTTVGLGHGETVGGSATVTVAAAQVHTTALASTVTVGAAAALNVGGVLAETVGGAALVAVGGILAETVAGSSREAVDGARRENVQGAAERRVGGDEAVEVKGAAGVAVERDLEEQIGGKAEAESVEPAAFLAKKLRIEPQDELCFEVGGKLLLSMKKSGDVVFSAAAFTVKADGEVALKGASVKLEAAGSAASSSASVTALKAQKAGKGVAQVALASAGGAALAGVRFKAELPDGSVVEGTTDAEGNAAIPSAKDGDVKITLPDLDQDSWSSG